jgi:hypothetical protein
MSVIALLTAACGADTEDPAVFNRGVLPAYSLAAEPSLVISDDGSASKVFSAISARRLTDGLILVADRGSAELRLFDPAGAFVSRLARRGSGPGELRGMFQVTTTPGMGSDSIFVMGVPPSSRAVSVFTPEGGFVRTELPDPMNAPQGIVIKGRLVSGEYLVERGVGFSVMNVPPELGRLIPDSATYGTLAISSDASDSVRWLPAVERNSLFAFPWPRGPIPNGASFYELGYTTQVVVAGDRIWLGSSKTGELRALSGALTELASVTIPVNSASFHAPALRRAAERAIERAQSALDSAKATAMYDPSLVPATMPRFADLIAGADGEVWVALFDVEPSDSTNYLVISAAGEVAARATLPRDIDIEQIGADFILGIARDSLGVESVVQHRLYRANDASVAPAISMACRACERSVPL